MKVLKVCFCIGGILGFYETNYKKSCLLKATFLFRVTNLPTVGSRSRKQIMSSVSVNLFSVTSIML